MQQSTQDAIKHGVDAISVTTLIGTLVQILPAIAAVFTIIWTAIRIWETETVQNWRKKKKG